MENLKKIGNDGMTHKFSKDLTRFGKVSERFIKIQISKRKDSRKFRINPKNSKRFGL